VSSGSYLTEIEKFFPQLKVYQEACPMWVPLIENNEFENQGAEFFIEKYVNRLMAQQADIDAIILGCTHYPLIAPQIRKYLPAHVELLSQGPIVAKGLKDYLIRHPGIEQNCSKQKTVSFYTTDLPQTFDRAASLFYGKEVLSKHLPL
jgi:glutamate racemase